MSSLRTSRGTTFCFNGDFAGDLHIVDKDENRAVIPMDDLDSFFIHMLQSEMVSRIEGEGDKEWLLRVLIKMKELDET